MYKIIMNSSDMLSVDDDTARELFFEIKDGNNNLVSYFNDTSYRQGLWINPRNVAYMFKENEE